MRTPSYSTAVLLAWIVMPRSRSRSSLSIARSCTSWLARKVPVWRRSPSSRVVLPWSTCAMIARLRMSLRGPRMAGGDGKGATPVCPPPALGSAGSERGGEHRRPDVGEEREQRADRQSRQSQTFESSHHEPPFVALQRHHEVSTLRSDDAVK